MVYRKGHIMSKSRHFKKVYRKDTPKKKWALVLLQAAVFLLLLTPIVGFSVFLYYTKDLPRPERLTEITLARPTKIYDRTGQVLLYEVFGEEKREFIPLEEIPLHFQQAVIATEDAEFYKHGGVSFRGTTRAILTNLGLRDSQFQKVGGSTITQQLARNSFLTREKTISRKFRELVLTLELERRYDKDEILEFYLNQIPFGSTAYGVGAATELYFQKEPKDLTKAESASLAALIQAPTFYSPHGPNRELLLGRKNHVLSRMVDEGFLSSEEAAILKEEELVFQDVALTIRAPHFVLDVLADLMARYGEDFVREQGLRVVTSLDWQLQQRTEQIVQEAAQQNVISNAHNAAAVVLNPQTGEILALVGSKDWHGAPFPEGCQPGVNCLFDPKVNVATIQQGRQPGSSFKPFVYALAFQKGATDETVVVDELTNFGVWGGQEYIPQNYDGIFRGEVTFREALAQSLNIPSVKVLLDYAGIEESVAFAKTLGITTLRNPSFYGPALVLGGGEARLLDMASAYGVFATGGNKIPPISILSVEDASGNTLERNQNTSIRVMPVETASLITDVLSDNEARAPLFGSNSLLHIPGARVAVKTGTTQEFRDGWTIGYTPNVVVGVWSGNSDNTPTIKVPGSLIAAPMWNRIMTFAISFPPPAASL